MEPKTETRSSSFFMERHNAQYHKPFPDPLLKYKVFAFQENPYVMLRQNHQDLEGNDRYEGFCVDMLKELADILKFKYRIRLVGDGHYGVPGTNGTWTGMVGELISRVGCCTVHSQADTGYVVAVQFS